VNALIAAGYPYEFIGLLYYVLFLMMGRKRFAASYTNRSRFLALLAAMAMIGCVPFRYAAVPLGVEAMFALAVLALASTLADAINARRRR
jgi:hypothetical protein